jgi:hypothetical protein
MKAIISSTFDDQYLFYLPITAWCWNKLGVDVICFIPIHSLPIDNGRKVNLIQEMPSEFKFELFKSLKHKEATYAQCSRLYASSLNLPEDEVLITSDIDMLVFNLPISHRVGDKVSVLGYDLVPEGQLPMCYASGTAKGWRGAMKVNGRSAQECLDDLLGGVEAEHFRGNYWSKDQETLYNNLSETKFWDLIPRAKPGTQFATKRIDRDDAYFLDRLSPDIIDYHCHRPGYTDDNFQKILSVISYFYPNEDLTWMKEYRQQYLKLI